MEPNNYLPQPNQPLFPEKPSLISTYRKKLKGVSGTVSLLIAAPLLALFLTAHVFQPYEVDGASMETTLQNADRLIVFKLPRTLANITGGEYTPDRWDVIVFDKPKRLSAPESTQHPIKRVIGLPGERVVIRESDDFCARGTGTSGYVGNKSGVTVINLPQALSRDGDGGGDGRVREHG